MSNLKSKLGNWFAGTVVILPGDSNLVRRLVVRTVIVLAMSLVFNAILAVAAFYGMKNIPVLTISAVALLCAFVVFAMKKQAAADAIVKPYLPGTDTTYIAKPGSDTTYMSKKEWTFFSFTSFVLFVGTSWLYWEEVGLQQDYWHQPIFKAIALLSVIIIGQVIDANITYYRWLRGEENSPRFADYRVYSFNK